MAESLDVPASWIVEVLRTDEKRLCRKFRSWNAWTDGHEPLALDFAELSVDRRSARSSENLPEVCGFSYAARYKRTPANHADLLSINCAQ